MRHPLSFVALSAIVCAIALSGCTAPASRGGVADPSLRGSWMLVSARDANGTLALADSRISLTIGIGAESAGQAPCGAYTAALYGTAAALRVRAAASKKSDCESPGASEIQNRYLVALDAVTHAEVGADSLELSAEGASLKFEPAPVVSYSTIGNRVWELSSVSAPIATNLGFVPAEQVETFQLDDSSHYSGTTGCRSFAGRYRLEAGHFVVLSRRVEVETCSTQEDAFDALVLSVFKGTLGVDSTKSSIELTNPTSGVILYYVGRTQYLDQH